jgi:hypothetical protein
LQAYDAKYEINPIINNNKVSVIAECAKNLIYLKKMLLIIPKKIPINNELLSPMCAHASV